MVRRKRRALSRKDFLKLGGVGLAGATLLGTAGCGGGSQQGEVISVIPQLGPVITMVTAITLIGGFAVFDNVFVMTGGGPGHASEVLGTYTYQVAFQENQAGYGSALAVLMTVLSLVSAVIFVRLRERQRDDT